jgi:hypothetical protein
VVFIRDLYASCFPIFRSWKNRTAAGEVDIAPFKRPDLTFASAGCEREEYERIKVGGLGAFACIE